MRSLFSSSELRRLEMIELLNTHDYTLTLSEVAARLGCSERILISDIDMLNHHCPAITIKRNKQRIFMAFNDESGPFDVYRCFLSHNQNFQLLETIFFEPHLRIEDLQNRLEISQATLYRQVNIINKALEAYFNITLETNPFRLTGKESAVRHFYRMYFAEKYSFQNWPDRFIPYDSLDPLIDIVMEEKATQLQLGRIHFLKLSFAINAIRIQQGYFLERHVSDQFIRNFIPNFEDTPLARGFRSTWQTLVPGLESELLDQELFYPYISDTLILDYHVILSTIKQHPRYSFCLMKIHRVVHLLQQEFHLSLDNLSELIINIHNTIQTIAPDWKRGYILNNPIIPLFDFYQKEHPAFFDRTQSLVTELLDQQCPPDYYLHQRIVQEILTSWKDLPFQLRQEYCVKILIFNFHSTQVAEFYRDLLYFQLPQPIKISIWRSYPISKEALEPYDYDVLITNILIPGLVDKEMISIDHLHRQSIERIIETVNRVRQHHKHLQKEDPGHA